MNDSEKYRLIQKCGGDMALIAETVGLDKAFELATIFQGDRIAFPKHICNSIRNSAIRQEYADMQQSQIQALKVSTISFLAGKYGLATRTIERIINQTEELSDR